MQLMNTIAVITLMISAAESAKILAVFPYPGQSQYILGQSLLKGLAARGHELTVLSHFPQKTKIANFRDIKLEYPRYFENVIKPAIEMGDTPAITEIFFELFKNVSIYALGMKEVQELLKSKTEHFDLVIVEALLTEVLYAFGEHFKAPLIGVSTFGTDPTIDSLVGNTSPASYAPLVTSSLTHHMTFWERLENLKLIFSEWLHVQRHHMPEQERLYKKHFPHLKRSLQDICKNFSLVFVNQHFSLSFPRPYVPAMIEVGGMHISHKAAPLPKDIEDFINGAENGAIYFAMGSNMQGKNFPQDKIDILLKVFGRLKQRVLWKFELTELPGKPENVFISQWFPQSDILAHPNVKLFISHFGLLSTMEAIHHATPILGMPVFYDQFMNLEHAKRAGYGAGINFHTFTESELSAAIKDVLENPSYQKAMSEISQRYHDQPMKPLDKAIYWTEYVLRHKGALHMRVAAQDLSFIAYHSLDTLGYLAFIWIVIPIIFLAVVLNLLKRVLASNAKSKKD